MKKLIFIIIFVLIQSTTVYALSPLHVDGKWVKNETNNIITLRGVNSGGFVDDPTGLWRCQGCGLWGGIHTWDPDAVKANLDNMSQTWGMNILRLHNSIEWWKTDNSSYRQHIKDVISWAGERGMYIIYDTYCVKYYPLCVQQYLPIPPYLNSTLGEDQVITSEQDFIDHWKNIAQELKDYPNVIFEIYNEPHGDDTVKEKYFNISQKIIDAIRSTGAEQLIIIQWDYGVWVNLDFPTSTHSEMSWVEDYSLNDPLNNLVYSAHLYRGNFHRTVGGRVDSWTYDEIKLGLQDCFVDYVINALNKPVIIGEIGANMWETGEGLEQELAFFNNSLSIFNEWNLSYIDWTWTTPAHMQHGVLQNTIWIPQPNDVGQILINKIAEGEANIPKAKFRGKLKDKNNIPIDANIILSKQGTVKIKYTSKTDSNGNYELSILPGIYDVEFNLTNFFIPGYSIKLYSVNITNDTYNIVESITGNQTENKVSIVLEVNNSQEIEIYNSDAPINVKKNGTSIANVTSLSNLRNNTWFYETNKLYIKVNDVSPLLTDLPQADYYVIENNSIYYAINSVDQQIFLSDTDASNVINAVFNVMKSGQTVAFQGAFRLTSTLNPKDNTILLFGNSEIHADAAIYLIRLTGRKGIVIDGGKFYGHSITNACAMMAENYDAGTDSITIKNGYFEGFPVAFGPVMLQYGRNYLVQNNTFINNAAWAVTYNNVGNSKILNNYVDSMNAANSGGVGIWNGFEGYDDNEIAFNTMARFGTASVLRHGIYIEGTSNCSIHDNECGPSPNLRIAGILVKAPNTKIFNNYIHDITYGLSIYQQHSGAYRSIDGSKIYNNTFTNTETAIYFGESVAFSESNINIYNNTVSSPAVSGSTYGVMLNMPPATGTMSNVTIQDNNVSSVAIGVGWDYVGSAVSTNGIKILRNTFANIASAVIRIHGGTNAVNTTIAYHDFSVAGTSTILEDAGTNTMVYDNIGLADKNVPPVKIPSPPSPP